jgi:hypothetical protein
MRRGFAPIATMGLAVLALSVCGCIEGEHTLVVRYDAKKDELHCLQIYSDLCGSTDNRNYMVELWRNRNHIIPEVGFPFGEFGSGAEGFVRLNSKEFVRCSLAERGKKEDVRKASFDLNEIKVGPGTFFLSKGQSLWAYQSAVFSGRHLDWLLDQASEQVRGAIASGIKTELERRAKGGKQLEWGDLRNLVVKTTKGREGKHTEEVLSPEQGNLLAYLSAESLKSLGDGADDKSLAIRRDKLLLSLHLKITKADAREIHALYQATAEALATELKDASAVGAIDGNLVQMVHETKLTVGDNGLTATLDYQKVIDSALSPAAVRKELTDREEFRPNQQEKWTIEAIRDANIPIEKKITVEGLLKAFEAGTLPVNPSKEEIEPGKGLFKSE